MEQGAVRGGAGWGSGGEATGGVCERTRSRRSKFIKTLTETCSVVLAARAAGRTVATCYRWRGEDAGFAAGWDAALATGYDRLEAALLDYAVTSIERGVEDSAATGTRSISHSDLQFAVGMLLRHRSADEDKKAAERRIPAATEAETDAALRRALDGLARREAAS